MKTWEAFAAAFGIIILGALMTLLGLFVTGWSIMMLWGWFVVPLLGLPALTIWTAVGLNLVWKAFAIRVTKADTDETNAISAWLTGSIVLPLYFVFIGWIVQGFFLQ